MSVFSKILDTLRSLNKTAQVSPGTSSATFPTEQNHQQTDDELVENQTGDTEISTYPEVHEAPQLNGEPHTSPDFNINEKRFLMLHSEDQESHLFFPDVDPNNQPGAGVGRAGPSISDGDKGDEKINKISSKKDLTLEDLRVQYPNVVAYLSKFGVLTLDKQTFESFYSDCTRKAMSLQKPISEVIKDA